MLGGVSLDVGVLASPQIWAQAFRSGLAPNMGTSVSFWLGSKYGRIAFSLPNEGVRAWDKRGTCGPNES